MTRSGRAWCSSPPTGCRRSCRSVGRREHRRATLQQPAALGPVNIRDERRRVRGATSAPDRHARPAPGAAPLRRQPAEGDDRALARERLPDAALLRPDARDRRRHEAPDLRPPARSSPKTAPRSSCSRASSPRSRSSATARLPLRRPGHGRARRRRGRRGDAAPGDARPRRRSRQHERGRREAGRPAITGAGSRAGTPGRSASTCSCSDCPLLADDPGASGAPSTSSPSRSTPSPSPSPRWPRRS